MHIRSDIYAFTHSRIQIRKHSGNAAGGFLDYFVGADQKIDGGD
jgi:hypothetical protein